MRINKKKRETCVCVQQGESNCKIENKILFYSVRDIINKNNCFSSKIVMITKKKIQNTLTVKKKNLFLSSSPRKLVFLYRKGKKLFLSFSPFHPSSSPLSLTLIYSFFLSLFNQTCVNEVFDTLSQVSCQVFDILTFSLIFQNILQLGCNFIYLSFFLAYLVVFL